MVTYTGRQIAILLALLVAAGIGLGVRHWRAAHPEMAERLERLDRHGAEPASRAAGPPRHPRGKPALGAGSAPLDLNSATVEELSRLPGVGPALAARIVAARNGGAFASVDDLAGVRGVGRARVERLRGLVRVD